MAIAFVTQATGLRNNATSGSVTISTPTAGNALIATICNNSNTNPSSVTGGGVTWALAKQQLQSTNRSAEVWYGVNSDGTGTTVTFTYAAKGHTSINVQEYSGVATSSALGNTNGATTTSTTIDAGSVNTVTSDELVVASGNNATGGVSPSAGPTNSFNALTYVNGGDDNDMLCAYRITTSAASYSTSWTVTSVAWCAAIAAFKGNSGSPSISPSPSSSVSSSISLSPSSSQSPSSSVSLSISLSPSSSVSLSISPSPSSSQSPSSSISASISPSPSSSESPSPSSSQSPSSSVSASLSPSPSSSISSSPSSSQSPSSSVSASISLSPSSSVSSSISPSPSSSQSPSSSVSSSVSLSPSSSVSLSISPSPSASPSVGFEGYTRFHYAALPADDTDLTTAYSAQDYVDVATADDVYVDQNASGGEYAIHQFKNFAGAFLGATFLWEGQTNYAPFLSEVFLQIYNHNTTTWDTIDSDNTTTIDVDFQLTAFVADLTNYKDARNVVSCRVYQKS